MSAKRGEVTPSGAAGGRSWAARGVALAFVLACVVGAFGVLAPAALAAPLTVTCGDTISNPGTYALAADCSGAGITINASDVSLKLKGHTMIGTDPGVGVGVLVDDSGGALTGVTIKGPGTITNYRCGVQLGKASHLCGDQSETGAGISGSRASGLTATNNDTGIAVGASDNTIEHNVASYHRTGSNLVSSDNTVKHNTADNNHSSGMFIVDSRSNAVEHNAASHNGFYGIILTGESSDNNTVEHNTATNNGYYGLALGGTSSSLNTVEHNTVTNNNHSGLFLARGSNNTLKHNRANDNNDDGIALLDSDSNTVDHNTATNNGIGIRLDDGSHNNTIEGNIAHGNTSYDLFDGNTSCDSNTWMANVFRTANQSCFD